jgi:hypothetical protein
VHAEEPTLEAKRPNAHALQNVGKVAPVAIEDRPSGHAAHICDPVDAE